MIPSGLMCRITPLERLPSLQKVLLEQSQEIALDHIEHLHSALKPITRLERLLGQSNQPQPRFLQGVEAEAVAGLTRLCRIVSPFGAGRTFWEDLWGLSFSSLGVREVATKLVPLRQRFQFSGAILVNILGP